MSAEAKNNSEKKHISVVVGGHVDSGKSTTVGHLLFELGGISERELQKLKEEAKALGKDSFCFAFFTDNQKQERERGITINCTTKEFYTPNYHYTVIDAPGHRDFIGNFLKGSAQADLGVLMVPADSGFITALQKGNHKAAEVQGQTRQHARLMFLLGIKQLIVCVNKMDDSQAAKYQKERFEEVRDEVVNMLGQVGWNKQFIKDSVPILPVSGWVGDNLFKKSDNMKWWEGQKVKNLAGVEVTVTTLHDALDKYAVLPKRMTEAPLRVPVSGVFKIKGVGDVITGRVEQGTLTPGQEVKFLPSSAVTNGVGKVFSIEMHHQSVQAAGPGDNVGINIKGLTKETMPKTGDVIVLSKDTSLGPVKKFTAQVQVLDHPGELKVGYCPIGFVRTAHSACKLSKIVWKMGKETNNQKVNDPVSIKQGEAAEVEFEPTQPLVVDKFTNCEGLSRIALMDGNTVIMLGKITDVTF
jgi:elongation factor 1-alpha